MKLVIVATTEIVQKPDVVQHPIQHFNKKLQRVKFHRGIFVDDVIINNFPGGLKPISAMPC